MGLVLLLSITGAVAPAAFMLHFVYVRDKYEREPLSLVLRVYFISFLTVIPALVLELAGLAALDAFDVPAVLSAALVAFAVVGFAEEGSKFLFVRRLAFHQAEFDEPYDGILYAVAVGLGFATVENVGYVLAAPDIGGRVALIIARALTSVPVHTLLGVVMGFYIGKAKFAGTPDLRRRFLQLGLVLPALAHGLYDFPLLAIEDNADSSAAIVLMFGAVAVVAMLWVVGIRMIRSAQAESPFKRPSPLMRPFAALNMSYKFCTNCGARAPRDAQFCAVCGATWRPLRTGETPPA
jgi:protease PrsW